VIAARCLSAAGLVLLTQAAIGATAAESAAPAASDAASAESDLLTKFKPANAVGDLIKSLTADMPVTTPPASFLLGAAGTDVPRVSTFRALGLQLSNAVGDDGKIKTTTAAEINPLLATGPVTWTRYRADPFVQVLTRTTLSVAVQPGNDTAGARSALGLQSVLYSKEVPEAIAAASSGDCALVATKLQAAAATPPASQAFPTPAQPRVPLPPGSEEAYKACKDSVEGLLTKWNPTAVTIGLGQAYQSKDSSVSGLHHSTAAAWLTVSLGHDFDDVKTPVQDRLGLGLTLHARRTIHGQATDPADSSVQVDEASNLYGANLRGGWPGKALLLEWSLRTSKAPPLADERRKRLVAAFEYRVMADLYLSAGIGSDIGRRDGQNQKLALMGLKWGFSSESVLK